jgi:hypothetical protein
MPNMKHVRLLQSYDQNFRSNLNCLIPYPLNRRQDAGESEEYSDITVGQNMSNSSKREGLLCIELASVKPK